MIEKKKTIAYQACELVYVEKNHTFIKARQKLHKMDQEKKKKEGNKKSR